MTIDFVPHPDRDAILGEVHARPHQPIVAPARILRFGFSSTDDGALAEREALTALCRRHGAPTPEPNAKHHRLELPDAVLRWERHTEFVSYTWYLSGPMLGTGTPAGTLAARMRELPQPGPHVLSVDVHVVEGAPGVPDTAGFDPGSLAMCEIAAGGATVATDFRADADGFVRILVVNHGLDPQRLSAWIQAMLELETYRLLALLGLPMAQRVGPVVRSIEAALADLTRDLVAHETLADSEALLVRLIRLAADLEAEIASSTYRFQATRAYAGIVDDRLAALSEAPVAGHPTLAAFLERRFAPAMRTCATVDAWQRNLAERLTRASDLLRTRIDIAMATQNHALLTAMNHRARVQLRLQQTVEGLSVAAISYYVVSLAKYVFESLDKMHVLPVDVPLATVISVPLVVGTIAFVVRRIRRAHGDD